MKIVHRRNDGRISITTFADNEISNEKAIEHADKLHKDNSQYTDYEIIDDHSIIPEDRYFREAWNLSDRKINIDMPKARDIHLNKLRNTRLQKFIDLGFPQRLNAEVENAILTDETKLKLKELRDFPQNMDLSTINDPVELKNTIPECLK